MPEPKEPVAAETVETTEEVLETADENTISIAKADWEAVQTRLHNADGYATRQVQETEKRIRQEYEDKIREMSTGDKDLDAVRRKALADLEEAKRIRGETNLRGLALTAAELAQRYKIDQKELAGIDNEPDMRVKAMTLYTARLEAEKATPKSNIDIGSGVKGVTTYDQIRDEYLKDPSNYQRWQRYQGARRERGV